MMVEGSTGGMGGGLLDAGFAMRMVRLCEDGWRQGWHERNAGNLSYRLSDRDAAELDQLLSQSGAGDAANADGTASASALRPAGDAASALAAPWTALAEAHPHLAGQLVALTASGSYFRAVAERPEAALGVVELNGRGDAYRIRAGFAQGARPTSELAAHLAAHELFARTGSDARVLYHAHVPAVAVMTNVLPPDSRAFTRALWSTMIECITIFPGGVGVVAPMVPGGKAIADETVRLMADHDAVVWSHHGALCPGRTFDEAFGLMHMIEKAARIWCDARSVAGAHGVVHGVDAPLLREIARAYGLAVHETYLDGDAS